MPTAGERPERTLVVTDALGALGELRALGVGVEHIPAASGRGRPSSRASPTRTSWPNALALIRAERPRPRKVVAARRWNGGAFGTLRALLWRPPHP